MWSQRRESPTKSMSDANDAKKREIDKLVQYLLDGAPHTSATASAAPVLATPVSAPIRATKLIKTKTSNECSDCQRGEDGTAVIGCGQCERWYHWLCVGLLTELIGSAVWLCRHCRAGNDVVVQQKASQSSFSSLDDSSLDALLCTACETVDLDKPMIDCRDCGLAWHLECVHLSEAPDDWRCLTCKRKTHRGMCPKTDNWIAGLTCAVCGVPDIIESSVNCLKCDRMFHKKCYAINGKSQWLCDDCENNGDQRLATDN